MTTPEIPPPTELDLQIALGYMHNDVLDWPLADHAIDDIAGVIRRCHAAEARLKETEIEREMAIIAHDDAKAELTALKETIASAPQFRVELNGRVYMPEDESGHILCNTTYIAILPLTDTEEKPA